MTTGCVMSIKTKVGFFKPSPQSSQHVVQTDRMDELLKRQEQAYQTYLTVLSQLDEVKKERAQIERVIRQELAKHATKSLLARNGTTAVMLTPCQTRVVIDSEDNIPLEYVTLFMRRQLNMQRIEADLKRGKKIPGAHLKIDEAIEVKSTLEDKKTCKP